MKTVNILGVDIPLDTIQYCTSTVPESMIGKFSDYMTASEFARLCYDPTPFAKMAERGDSCIPFHAGRSYQFFQYADV
jgi:hypothetical protein